MQKVLQQVKSVLGGCGEHVAEASGLRRRERLEHGLGQGTLNGFDVFRAGSSSHLQHTVQLVQSRSTGEERLSENELCQDATHAPHVHSLGVLVRAEQDLRGTVPPSSHVIGEYGVSSSSLGVERAGQSKISDLDMTL